MKHRVVRIVGFIVGLVVVQFTLFLFFFHDKAGNIGGLSPKSRISLQVIHWNVSAESQPKIYTCQNTRANGMDEFLSVMTSVLPEYQMVDLSFVGNSGRPGREWFDDGWKHKQTNTYDIFMGTDTMLCSSVILLFLMQTFRGRLVYFSGEDTTYPLSMKEHMHFFGPVENVSKRDIRIYYFQFVWWHKYRERLPPMAMVDGRHRPKGKQHHFLIYAAANCVNFREEAFSNLSMLGNVHYGGKCKGNSENKNVSKVNSGITLRNWWANVDLYEDYRFCLVMEHNGNHYGYITEKILMAYIAGCIPIYYGPSSVFDVFSSESFVFYDINNPNPALQLIAELEKNRTKYIEMMGRSILAEGARSIEKYFSFNDEIGGGRLKRAIRD
jgi:hypothetical protein